MKTVIQRVKHASVSIDGKVTARIDQGLMILLGIADDDDREAAPQPIGSPARPPHSAFSMTKTA